MKITVVLSYPDHMTDDGEIYVYTATVPGEFTLDDSRDRAFYEEAAKQARAACIAANPESELEPDELGVVALFAGEPELLAGPLDDL